MSTQVFLDAGCGKGRALVFAATLPFHAVHGFDLSPMVVMIALVLFAIATSTLYLNTYAWWDPKTQERTF